MTEIRPLRAIGSGLACAAAAVILLSSQPAPAQLGNALGSVTRSAGGAGRCRPAAGRPGEPQQHRGRAAVAVKNKYLGGDAQATGSSVLGKLTGEGQAKDKSAFDAGNGSLLQSGGDGFSLGGGIKEKVTEQVCDLVLQHAQSLL
ncbi:MAG: DUF2501 domain-containing protein [Geminicoccaceae bacterium]